MKLVIHKTIQHHFHGFGCFSRKEIEYRVRLTLTFYHVYMPNHVKERTVTVSLRTVNIPNIGIKVWTQEIEFRKGTSYVP